MAMVGWDRPAPPPWLNNVGDKFVKERAIGEKLMALFVF
jgi:hypothetical protein